MPGDLYNNKYSKRFCFSNVRNIIADYDFAFHSKTMSTEDNTELNTKSVMLLFLIIIKDEQFINSNNALHSYQMNKGKNI